MIGFSCHCEERSDETLPQLIPVRASTGQQGTKDHIFCILQAFTTSPHRVFTRRERTAICLVPSLVPKGDDMTTPLRPEQVRELIKGGNARYADGHSLYLVVKNGRGFWTMQYRDPNEGGTIRWHGLGSAEHVTPAAARRARESHMAAVREGRAELPRRKAKGELFSMAASAWLDNHESEWTTRTRADNKALFARYVPAQFAGKPVTQITADDVAAVLRPIWNGPGNDKTNRLRRMIEDVLKAKAVHPNPADWGGPLSSLLSRKRREVEHHDAMPWQDVPAFYARLSDSTEDRAGKFVILTSVRRDEALEAHWSEFDFVERVWTIPAEHTKRRKVFKVPLTDQMIAVLGTPGAPDAYLFPSSRTGRKMGNKALDKDWFARNGATAHATLHGFRSSMTDWIADYEGDDLPRDAADVAKKSLAHKIGDQTDRSYQRSEQFGKRRKLAELWNAYAINNCK